MFITRSTADDANQEMLTMGEISSQIVLNLEIGKAYLHV
jgi:hypothetical protein